MKIIISFILSYGIFAFADIQKGGSTGTLSQDPAHISLGSLPLKEIHLYKDGTLKKIWEDTENPVITGFSVAPDNIDLDTRSSGTITFTIAVTGTAGSSTYAQVVQLPNGTNIGPTQVATGGANISTTIPNIVQPQQTTSYRLFVHNTAGTAHKDATVTVTKNPTLANCRRTNVINRTGFSTYTFGFTLTGLPRPVVTYSFSGGQTGNVNTSHYNQSGNPYTWDIRGWNITFSGPNAQSLTLTATNASGTATCTISNINS